MFQYTYITTKGMRKTNQDALLIQTAKCQGREILFAAVCDGMGGLSCGEHASAYTVSEAAAWFSGEFPKLAEAGADVLDIRVSLDDLLHRINDDINQAGEQLGEMGTTCTAVLLDPEKNYLLAAHVGDTRLYRITDQTAEVLTTDHSVIAEELRRGLLTEEKARTDSRQNQITNCIGAGETDRAYDYIILEPETDCTYLLCSDGFRKLISEEEIRQTLAPAGNPDADSLKRHLTQLTDLNLERQENDNITAVTVKYIKENSAG